MPRRGAGCASTWAKNRAAAQIASCSSSHGRWVAVPPVRRAAPGPARVDGVGTRLRAPALEPSAPYARRDTVQESREQWPRSGKRYHHQQQQRQIDPSLVGRCFLRICLRFHSTTSPQCVRATNPTCSSPRQILCCISRLIVADPHFSPGHAVLRAPVNWFPCGRFPTRVNREPSACQLTSLLAQTTPVEGL